MTSPTSFDDLDRAQRRRLVLRSSARIFATTVALLVIYAVIPVVGKSGAAALIELIIGLAVFVGILVWEVRTIVKADHPELQAIEALALALIVLIIVFTFTYLSLYHADHSSFSQPLDRIGAFYFSVTVLSTVGFGDISAKTDAARILVTIQIVLDFALITAIARTVVFAARVGVRRQKQRSRDGELND